MARIASVAIGGYYPTPPSVAELIKSKLEIHPNITALDPCAGEGEAASIIFDPNYVAVHAIELEKTRYNALRKNKDIISYYGDSLRSEVIGEFNILYLNPPYDYDSKHKRLEEKFLSKFSSYLMSNGLLIFVVPFYALEHSANTLSKHFDNMICCKLPDEEFAVFKQVVLFARKRAASLLEPDVIEVNTINSWAKNSDSIPLITEDFTYTVTRSYYSNPRISILPIDLSSIKDNYKPWEFTTKHFATQKIPGIIPEGNVRSLMLKTYPIVTPPRPAHIAAGIASGIFNGYKISSKKNLPDLLVKGLFSKEYQTIEEKKDKEDVVKGIVQVQQPELSVTILNLDTYSYHTLESSASTTEFSDVSEMTLADLLDNYGEDLMKVMLKQCPVLHDPNNPDHHIELPDLKRPLFNAQSHATQATIKLLGGLNCKDRKFKSAFVLGELGSGKTSVAIAAAKTIKSNKTLVLCPPHLLDSWKEQIELVNPIKTIIVQNIEDIDIITNEPGPLFAILSRETAKLGHSWESVKDYCPKCGGKIENIDHSKIRGKCKNKKININGAEGQLALRIVNEIWKTYHLDPLIRQIKTSKIDIKTIESIEETKKTYTFNDNNLKAIFKELINAAKKSDNNNILNALGYFAAYFHNDNDLLMECYQAYQTNNQSSEFLFLLNGSQELNDLYFKHNFLKSDYIKGEFKNARNVIYNKTGWYMNIPHLSFDVSLKYNNIDVGDKLLILQAFRTLVKKGITTSNVECGEPLYQALPVPRRYPVSNYIAKKYKNLFDFLILDEGHEYSNDDSAQSHAAHRLTALGIPTILLTGTIMNGYADSLFTNMWSLNDKFRFNFNRDDLGKFSNIYGYRKRLVEDKDMVTKKVVEFGSMTDRCDRTSRIIGRSPGVLPLFLFEYLLPISVTLHKSDLAINLPECKEIVVNIEPDSTLLNEYNTLLTLLIAQIKKDRFTDLSGKLWGAMAHFPSYLDLATSDVGNQEDGRYLIKYPDSVAEPIVAEARHIGHENILPKEQWMIDQINDSIAEGRNVLVLAWHTRLLPRLVRLIETELGIKVPLLDPGKVSTRKRQEWINKEVIKKKARVMAVNPVAIQTGLNNLVYFSDQIWMENPGCNPIHYRQTVGRVDRIGQTKETRIYFPTYTKTAQINAHSLLMHKVGVSLSTDGLDAESALTAAGIGSNDSMSSFAIGRQLYEMITREMDQ